MLITVVIPVFNGEAYLSEAIESVLSQTYLPIEVLVVDDGSTDRSREIARSYSKVCYIYQDNAGHASARNRGIREAKGEFIAFLDADDLWMPDKLMKQMQAFSVNPDLDIVTGHVEQFFSPELAGQSISNNTVPQNPLPGYSPSAILGKRDIFEKVGFFHDQFRVGEFISWFSKVLDSRLNLEVLPDTVARRRIHKNNISLHFREEKQKAILQILKTSLDRKRNGD